MKNMTSGGRRVRCTRSTGFLLTGIIVLMLVLSWTQADAATPSLGDESRACQKCHDKPDLEMRTQDGKTWPLHVPTAAYLESRHGTTDCADCHDDIDDDKHARDKPAVKSRRDYALTLNEGCKTCHKKHVTQFKDSVHAALLEDGSDKAPLCSDCHAVHTLLSVKIVTPIADTPCLKCHQAIGKAYAGDVHGLERVAKGKAAPSCADCHQAHAIHAASSGDGLKDACLSCHKEALAQHKDWLPNAGRHFEAISCPVCHAPTAERRVNLRLYDSKGKQLVMHVYLASLGHTPSAHFKAMISGYEEVADSHAAAVADKQG